MKFKTTMLLGFALILLLAACNGNEVAEASVPVMESVDASQSAKEASQTATVYDAVVDEQGAVSVAVTPMNLDEADPEALTFEVTMNTHSVDLRMDLALLATLTTDSGREVSAALWDAQPGGHHVTGILSFPAMVEGTTLLADASRLTLTIRDVDAPERIFSWQLNH